MIGDTFERKDCQGGDCKVFELKTATKAKRKVYNTTLTKDMQYNGVWAKAVLCFPPCWLTLLQGNLAVPR